jgi:hypothetical protein
MFNPVTIVLCFVILSVSVWLISVSRTLYETANVVTALPPTTRVFRSPKLSRFLVLYGKFTEGLRPFVGSFYPYGRGNRRKILRTIAVTLGLLPASLVGVFLLLMGRDIATASLLIALGLILVLLLRILYLYSRTGLLDGGGGARKYQSAVYTGQAKLPKRVYIGDSKNFSIELTPSMYSPPQERPVSTENQRDDQVGLKLSVPISSDYAGYLEVELMGAGFEIRGETRQRQALNSTSLSFMWNCYFPNSGNHSCAFAFYVVGNEGSAKIGHIEHAVKVVRLDHLTQLQLGTFAAIIGIPSGIVLFVNALKALVEFLSQVHFP